MKINFYCLFLFIVLCVTTDTCSAQLIVTPSLTAYQLAKIIAGQGVTVSNVVYTGDPVASGSFTSTGTNLGLASGILLSTGNAIQAEGPNDDDASTASLFVPGDADLETLTGGLTNDASVLEFDFVPQSDTLTFRYVFASEEYPEFVCSDFNDVFGFFISGPGIAGIKNLAIIPGTTSFVAINTVNSGVPVDPNDTLNPLCGFSNSAYYVDNASGPDIQYDGFTTVLTAEIVITRCETYHLKLAIADGTDAALNSGVFIEGGSLHSTTIVYAGNDVSACVNLNAVLGSSPTVGWNYTWTPSAGLSNPSVSNPTVNLTNLTSSSVSYNYAVSAENGTTCVLHDTVVVTINPFPDSPFVISLSNACSNDTIQVNYAGNAVASNYIWNFGGATVISGTDNGPYSLVYPNAGNYDLLLTVAQNTCVSAPTVHKIHVTTAPKSTFTVPASLCGGATADVIYTGNYNSPTVNYNWNFGGGTILSGAGFGPYKIQSTSNGISNYVLTVSDSGCSSKTTHPVTSTPIPVASIGPVNNFCTGDTININYTGTLSPTSTYIWHWSNGQHLSGSGPGPHQLKWNTQINDSISVTVNDNGCRDTAYIRLNSFQPPVASINVPATICEGNAAVINYIGSSSAITNYWWSMAGASSVTGSGQGPINATWNSPGKKAVIVVASNNNCSSKAIDTIEVVAYPIASFSAATKLCSEDTLSLSFNGTAGASSVFSWNFGNAQQLAGSGTGPYSLLWNAQQNDSIYLIVNDRGCRDTVVKVISILKQPVAAITFPPALCENETGTISFAGSAISGTTLQWNFNNPTSVSGSGPFSISWHNAGIKNISVIADNNGCADTSFQSIKVNDVPLAGFSLTPACEGLPALFANHSVVTGSNISGLYWNFGDQSTLANDTAPSHFYAVHSIYSVQLIAQSSDGCTDTIRKPITIYEKPVADFIADTVCKGNATMLKDLSVVGTSSLYKWKWLTDDGDSSAIQNNNHLYNAGGIYKVSLMVETQQGCFDTVTKFVRVWKLPEISFTPLMADGCQPLIKNFNNTSTCADGIINQIKWAFGDSSVDSVNTPSHLYSDAGIFPVSLYAKSSEGCFNDTTISSCITVYPKPVADFEYYHENPDMFIPKVFFTNRSTFTTTSFWNFDDGKSSDDQSPEHTYREPGNYRVKLYVTSDEGCKDTISETLVVKDVFTLYVPNAFSPNGDIVNDQLIVQGYGIISYAINIFNRWGQLIFSSDSMDQHWDGTMNGREVPQGTYAYLINVRDFTTKKHQYSGNITLYR